MSSRPLSVAPLTVILALASAACSGPTLPTAIAARRSQIVESIPNADLSSAPEDPDTLFLLLGSEGRSCADPFFNDVKNEIDCSDFWRASIAVSPALAKPGSVVFGTPDISSGFMKVTPKGPGCIVDSASFTTGTLVIRSVDESQVVLELVGVESVTPGDGAQPVDPNGKYTAGLCP